MKRVKWTTPKLKILSRLTPEEFVLTRCKQNGAGIQLDPGFLVQECGNTIPGNCAACSARGTS
ncbi:MAG: hypothetical protein KAR14_14165 [Candidatus Aminicenantes bacterium]|nr:hypothetical protein [Candidatus Aminicenantes bacterium]